MSPVSTSHAPFGPVLPGSLPSSANMNTPMTLTDTTNREPQLLAKGVLKSGHLYQLKHISLLPNVILHIVGVAIYVRHAFCMQA